MATGGQSVIGIAMPAAWTAAGVSFQVSPDGGTTWNELASASTVVAVTAAAGQYIYLGADMFAGVNMLKVRSGTSGVPVVQGADRIVTLILKALV